MKCRHCGSSVQQPFVDLGFAPPSNAYLTNAQLSHAETYFPLRVRVCEHCWLVQTEDYTQADELFNEDYAYFSSTSLGWLEHARQYTSQVTQRFSLDSNSLVVEIASNDGYLLRNFVDAGIPCLGIEPTKSTAEAARKLNIPVLTEFFGAALADILLKNNQQADLLIGNNVYAHVPDINDFTLGLKRLLKPTGTITLEFPHLLQLIRNGQFDTIYHEHFSYFSLSTVISIFSQVGLRVWDVEQISTHGGSLRIYGCHMLDMRPNTARVAEIIDQEHQAGLNQIASYQAFQKKANNIKDNFLMFLLEQKKLGKSVIAYGAAAKGNTLLNYAGVKSDLLPMVCDAAPSKQDKYLPGSHIPIVSPDILYSEFPDYLLILPWNLSEEVMSQYSFLKSKGTQFVVALPELKII